MSAAWDRAYGQPLHGETSASDGVADGVSESTGRIVIFDGDEASMRRMTCANQRRGVDGLD